MERTFDRFSALDSFFLEVERDDSPMHLGAVCLFEEGGPGDRRITLRRLRAHIEARLDSIPRYRQRLLRVPFEGHPVWVDAADFDIADHVRGVALPAPGSPGHLEETVSWILSRPLSRRRPLWEIWLIEGLPQGGFALACKTHHCLADGLGAAALLCAILGTEPFSIPETPRAWRPRPLPSNADLLRDAVATRVRGATALAASALGQATLAPGDMIDGAAGMWSALRAAASAAWTPPAETLFDEPRGSDRRFLWWSVALDDIKRIGRRLGGTVNDVALTLVSEGYAQTALRSGAERNLRVYCPVGSSATPASTITLGNRVSGMLLDLPAECPDLRSRWNGVVAAARACKASGSAEGTFLLENVATALSPGLLSRLEGLVGGQRMFNLIMTNVPGPSFPLYLFERKMTGVCPLVPLLHGQSIGIAIFSYAGTLTWGFHVDSACVDTARQLRSAVAAATLRLARLANDTVSAAKDKARTIPFPPKREVSREGMESAAAAG